MQSTTATIALGALALALPAVQEPERGPAPGPYSPEAAHVWNRVHRALFLRRGPDGEEHGMDALDPYLWESSDWLLTAPRLAEALEALDAFLAGEAQELVPDPLRRAVFQRDLWVVFDWLAGRAGDDEARDPLMQRLAWVMERVALDADEIATLPDNYAAAVAAGAFPSEPRGGTFLPRDLWADDGPWIALADGRRGPSTPLAVAHAHHFRGREVLPILMRTSDERAQTLDYLDRLRAARRSVACDGTCGLVGSVVAHEHVDPDVPQFAAGTVLALARRMMVIDREGLPRSTPIVLGLQLRVVRDLGAPQGTSAFRGESWKPFQLMVEFELSRAGLFAGEHGGLEPVRPGDVRLPLFSTHGIDLFEVDGEHFQPRAEAPLDRCFACHGAPGVLSMNSFTNSMSGPGTSPLIPLESTRALVPAGLESIEAAAAAWKRARYDWGLLRGLQRARGG